MKADFSVLRDVDSRRVLIKPDTPEKDGLILIRPGVPDVSIGDRKYSQVRIIVNEFFIQGLAIYSEGIPEDIPDGYDIVVFTGMSIWELLHHAGKKGVIKKLKTRNGRTKIIDRNNPFGATVERTYSIEEGSNVYNVDIDFDTLRTDRLLREKVKEELEIYNASLKEVTE